MATAQCQVWGVLNVTADSFSDGGEFLDLPAAVARAELMWAQGASVIDVGGESTRPGAQRISAEVELERVLPVVSELAKRGMRVSIDTMRAEVAVAAVRAGARIVNDVSGGQADAQMHPAVSELPVDYVLMHWRGHSDQMHELAHYTDVVAQVRAEWDQQRSAAVTAGIPAERIIFDPGLGFAKLPEHNWTLLREIERLQSTGHRMLIGASRKRFLAEVSAQAAPHDRDAASAAVTMYAALHRCYAVRVHDVHGSMAAVRAAQQLLKEEV